MGKCFSCGKPVPTGDWNCVTCEHTKNTKSYWRERGIIIDDSCALDSRYTGNHSENLEPEVWEYTE